MKRLVLITMSLAALACAGCGQQNIKDVLSNLDKDCVRHYAGSAATGAPGSATVTFTIDCKPSGVVVTPAPAPATGP